MANQRCKDFINNLISNLRSTASTFAANVFPKFPGGIVENFDRMHKEFGTRVSTGLSDGTWAETTTWGGITFNKRYFSFEKDVMRLEDFASDFHAKTVKISREMSTTFTLVHELVHAYYIAQIPTPGIPNSGRYLTPHADMAEAAQKALVQSGIVKDAVPIVGNGSGYFDDALALACSNAAL